jgi:hypothetical protein
MKEPNAKTATGWKRRLDGPLWWIGWVLSILALSAVSWLVIGFVSSDSYELPAVSRCLLSVAIGLSVTFLLRFLAWCFCSWRNFKRLLFGLGCLVGLVLVFYAEEDIRGRLSWAHFQSHWQAKGEKFTFAAVTPPPIPDDQNFAMAPIVASTYSRLLEANGQRKNPSDTNVVVELQMPLDVDNGGPTKAVGDWQKAIHSNLEAWQQYYRDLAPDTNLFPVGAQPQSAGADVLLALSKYDSKIEDLRKAAARPGSRFPVYYQREQPFAILLPHLAPLKSCAVVLRLRALAELQAGHSEAALADVRLALNLTEKIRSEPFLISHLVRIAMFQITAQAIWEGTAEHRWTEAQLSKLQQQLAMFDFVADYQAAMRGENACEVATVDFLRHSAGALDSLGESGENGPNRRREFVPYLIPSGWFYQNELRTSQFILEQFLPVADASGQTFSPELVAQASQSLNAMPRTPYTFICRMLLPGLTKSSHRFAVAQASLNFARSACALERYRLDAGKYPATLDALVPRFMPRVPSDPIGGQPLHYRTTEDGNFIVYSVGWNETDDGGNVRFTNNGSIDLDQGDWVWRHPTTLDF